MLSKDMPLGKPPEHLWGLHSKNQPNHPPIENHIFGPFPKVAHPLHEKSAKDGAVLQKRQKKNRKPFGFRLFLVEVTGFEPATFWSRTKRATKLRYTSISCGANEGTRTPDLLITNQLLYQLSYIGVWASFSSRTT